MTKIQYYQLKNYIKVVIDEIKPVKRTLKRNQSYCSNVLKFPEEMENMKNFLLRRLAVKIKTGQKDLLELKRLFRYLHIVYCIARGQTYSQIEQKVRQGNQIDYKEIEFYFKKAGVEIPKTFKLEIENRKSGRGKRLNSISKKRELESQKPSNSKSKIFR